MRISWENQRWPWDIHCRWFSWGSHQRTGDPTWFIPGVAYPVYWCISPFFHVWQAQSWFFFPPSFSGKSLLWHSLICTLLISRFILIVPHPCSFHPRFFAFLLGSGTSFPHLCWLSDFFRLIQWHRLLISSKTCFNSCPGIRIPSPLKHHNGGSISVKRCNIIMWWHVFLGWWFGTFFIHSVGNFMILNWLSYFFRGVRIPPSSK